MIHLLGLNESVYTRIARLALEEKQLDYEFEEVDVFAPAGVPPAYRSLNPFGNIPSLRHVDLVLYETVAICRYIDEAFDGLCLQPVQPGARARMTQIISLLDNYAYRAMVWDVYVQRVEIPAEGGKADEQQINAALQGLRTVLEELVRLGSNQPFLCGSSISLADLHLYPMLHYFSKTPEGALMLNEFEGLQNWMALMRSKPSVIASCSP